MQRTLTGSALFLFALLASATTASSGNAWVNFGSPPLSSRDFGTLFVDARTAPPVGTNHHVHVLPPLSERTDVFLPNFSTVPDFTATDDLIYHGGKTVSNLSQYDLYVNCPRSCWAAPAGFEDRLGLSGMIHIVDQYVHAGTYVHGGGAQVTYTTGRTLYDPDIWKIVLNFIKQNHTPTGYAAMYHVFLKQGTDECDNSKNFVYKGCYAPDANRLDFCAYHGSVDLIVGHVLYSVEPYQPVTTASGYTCKQQPPTPNGLLAESTFTTLSHEIFETITDPDADAKGNGDAWTNKTGAEIGDICRSKRQLVTLHDRQYNLQGEYSNRIHGCAW